jgi:hypothetical protein
VNVEQFIAIAAPVAILLGPLVAFMLRVSNQLGRIEERIKADHQILREIVDRHDKQLHDLRNTIHGLNLRLVAKGVLQDKPHHE